MWPRRTKTRWWRGSLGSTLPPGTKDPGCQGLMEQFWWWMGECCHCLVSSRPAVSVSLLPVGDSSGVCIGQFWQFTASSCHPRGPFHMSWALPRLGWTQLVLTLLVLVSSVLREGRNTQWGKPGTENCAPGLTGRSFWPCSSFVPVFSLFGILQLKALNQGLDKNET